MNFLRNYPLTCAWIGLYLAYLIVVGALRTL